MSGSAAFYNSLALDLACVGAVVFLYAITAPPLGLAVLQALVSRTGGILNLYTDVEDCSVPDDVYKQLSRPFASQGVLRLRTSPELTVSQSFGPIVLDEVVEQLYHLPGCHGETTVAFSLEFTSSSGFGEEHDAFPTMQVAYSYSTLVPAEAGDTKSEGGTVPVADRWVNVRRLRVHTI